MTNFTDLVLGLCCIFKRHLITCVQTHGRGRGGEVDGLLPTPACREKKGYSGSKRYDAFILLHSFLKSLMVPAFFYIFSFCPDLSCFIHISLTTSLSQFHLWANAFLPTVVFVHCGSRTEHCIIILFMKNNREFFH